MIPERPTVPVRGAPAIDGLTFRMYRDEADLPALIAVINACEIADESFEIYSLEAARNWLTNLNDFEPTRDLLLAAVDGRAVAAAHVLFSIRDGVRMFDTYGWVHPDWRRRGLGRALLGWGQTRQRERAAGQTAAGDDRPGSLGSWTVESATGAVALLVNDGYEPVRWFFEMTRPNLDDLPVPLLPEGLELRPVTEDLVRQVLAADSEAFQDHWGAHELTEADVLRTLGDPDNDLSLWQVAWAGDEVVGSVMAIIFPAENAAQGIQRGWLERASVRRPWRRRGVARALMTAALQELRRRGMRSVSLGVDADNPTGALALHEGLGFQVERRAAAYRKAL
jgi:mycothiol synthase